ncbi:hypothetical protein [Rhodopseudomonas sp. B29]|uniref:SorB family sulfite dehydrogenase c-type cytochrome subunit n=1 Tax=Rhodopseudomonas sp. B29 TaxID=95607 RepID=UPI00034AD229|nr:hypothetical protein [Rhodopseudomonas sp. B29]
MKPSKLFAVACVGVALTGLCAAAIAKPFNYKLPDETAAFKPGPHVDTVRANCSLCHSADYIATQPPQTNKKAFWQAEVTKMIKVYGAPIEAGDVDNIVDYLAATY